MSYTYYQAKNPATINITDEHVTESELPERLAELNRKTTALTYYPEINDQGYINPACTGISTDLFVNGALTGVIVIPNNKIDIETLQTKSQAITYDSYTGVITISGNTETSNLKVTYDIDTYTLSVGDGAQFNGSVSFQSTVNGYNINTELSKLQHMSVSDEETIISGTLRAGNLVGIAYDSNLNTTFFSGNLSSPNISSLSLKLSGITYDEDLGTLIEGNRVGSPDIFRYDAVTPFIPIVGSDGITEVGHRIDFHRATNEEDYTVGLQVAALNRLSIRHNITAYAGDLELGTTFFRNTGGTCGLFSNHHSNLQWTNNAGVNTWIMDATTAGERWSTTRDNALAAFTRTTGMTYTPSVEEPDPVPARTTFAHNISSVECYANRYHTNSTSSLPINSVASSSTWGAIRIVRTGLAQNTPCGFMFGRGNDPTNMPKNLCAMYYVSPTTDISNGEIRIGIETEASTSSANCITFDTDTKETRLPGNLRVAGMITEQSSKTITHYTMYEGELHPGFFVESTGQIFHNGETSYENCMVIVRQATIFNNNIIGVCTEVIDHEYCKFATHGDCLIKCESATYTCGDIIVPSTNGFGKKGSSTDVLNCMLSMTPRLKVTSVDTDEIDPQCVVGFITV